MQTVTVYRARFGEDIVAEFMPSEKPSRKVAIIASGAPGYPGGKEDLMEFLAKKGYWSIIPRYRGTWESDGTFLEFPPSDDIFVVMDQVSAGFRDLWSGGDYRIEDPEFYLIGGSTGGAAALLASVDARVKKVATLSAVVDWREQENTMEPLDFMSRFVPAAFGQAYRADPSVWTKLAGGGFFNPIDEKENMDGKKLLLIHAKDDLVVHAAPAEAFAREVGAAFVLLREGGHMGARAAHRPEVWKHIEAHFKD